MLLHLKTPCCQRAVSIPAQPSVPVEKFERRCKHATWTITRTTLSENSAQRIDKIDWTIEQ